MRRDQFEQPVAAENLQRSTGLVTVSCSSHGGAQCRRHTGGCEGRRERGHGTRQLHGDLLQAPRCRVPVGVRKERVHQLWCVVEEQGGPAERCPVGTCLADRRDLHDGHRDVLRGFDRTGGRSLAQIHAGEDDVTDLVLAG